MASSGPGGSGSSFSSAACAAAAASLPRQARCAASARLSPARRGIHPALPDLEGFAPRGAASILPGHPGTADNRPGPQERWRSAGCRASPKRSAPMRTGRQPRYGGKEGDDLLGGGHRVLEDGAAVVARRLGVVVPYAPGHPRDLGKSRSWLPGRRPAGWSRHPEAVAAPARPGSLPSRQPMAEGEVSRHRRAADGRQCRHRVNATATDPANR